MTSPSIPRSLRDQVKRRAGFRCEYCRTAEWLSGIEGEIDHIIPRSEGGSSDLENLCYACAACNGYKQAKTSAIDPLSKTLVHLFHPRKHVWEENFAWSDDTLRIIGLTPVGRATVEGLRLNHPLAVSARTIWSRVGYHPPPEDGNDSQTSGK
ncbi:MAG: HNH endonuclease [Anaerolineae bacterium]|nr:HNH endonuclease [Anaerolineae bacterium]